MSVDRSIVLSALVIAALAASGCQPPSEPPRRQNAAPPGPVRDPGQDRVDVIQAHESLVEAFRNADVDAFVRVLDPDPDLLIFHPRLVNRFDGTEKVRTEMGRMFEKLGGAEWSDYHLIALVEGDVAWITAEVTVEAPSLDPPFIGRGTEIYLRKPDGWKLVHGHWSEASEG